ncbi:hypothetical protein RCL1_004712 [Eukaryota sp. TZLM3-RCL]
MLSTLIVLLLSSLYSLSIPLTDHCLWSTLHSLPTTSLRRLSISTTSSSDPIIFSSNLSLLFSLCPLLAWFNLHDTSIFFSLNISSCHYLSTLSITDSNVVEIIGLELLINLSTFTIKNCFNLDLNFKFNPKCQIKRSTLALEHHELSNVLSKYSNNELNFLEIFGLEEISSIIQFKNLKTIHLFEVLLPEFSTENFNYLEVLVLYASKVAHLILKNCNYLKELELHSLTECVYVEVPNELKISNLYVTNMDINDFLIILEQCNYLLTLKLSNLQTPKDFILPSFNNLKFQYLDTFECAHCFIFEILPVMRRLKTLLIDIVDFAGTLTINFDNFPQLQRLLLFGISFNFESYSPTLEKVVIDNCSAFDLTLLGNCKNIMDLTISYGTFSHFSFDFLVNLRRLRVFSYRGNVFECYNFLSQLPLLECLFLTMFCQRQSLSESTEDQQHRLELLPLRVVSVELTIF